MKKLLTFFLLILCVGFFVPVTSAKFKDCWGNWQKGYPRDGDCYQVSSVGPDDTTSQIPSSASSSYGNSRYAQGRNTAYNLTPTYTSPGAYPSWVRNTNSGHESQKFSRIIEFFNVFYFYLY